MHTLIALLVGVLMAIASVAILVHDNTAVTRTSTRVLFTPTSTRVQYNYGSGGSG